MVSLPRRRSISDLVRVRNELHIALDLGAALYLFFLGFGFDRQARLKLAGGLLAAALGFGLRAAASFLLGLAGSAASRSRRSVSSWSERRLASSWAIFLSSASRRRASARARSRASFSSLVRVRSTMPGGRAMIPPAGAQVGAQRLQIHCLGLARFDLGRLAGARRALTLDLHGNGFGRPWEKFCRTRPCSTDGRFTLNVRPIPCLLVSLVSLISFYLSVLCGSG